MPPDDPPPGDTATVEIEIANRQTRLPVDESAVLRVVETLLRVERVRSAAVSVAVVDDPTIHRLNREHLAHDYPTDVISFALHEGAEETAAGEPPRGAGRDVDGEVVVSADTAVRTAAELNGSGEGSRWSAHDELLLYVVHGLLHVVGYDDRTGDERDLMRSREQVVLRKLGIEPRYPEDDGPHEEDASPAVRERAVGDVEFGEDR